MPPGVGGKGYIVINLKLIVLKLNMYESCHYFTLLLNKTKWCNDKTLIRIVLPRARFICQSMVFQDHNIESIET